MIENIISYIAAAIAALAAYVVIPYVKERMGEVRFQQLKSWVRTAVLAAEQVFSESGMGEEKKRYVAGLLEDRFESLSQEESDALIESAVYCMNMEMWDE